MVIKKILLVICSLLFLLGCSKTEIPDKNILSEPGKFPLTKDKKTLKIVIQKRDDDLVEDFVNNEFTKWYEEKTNVHLDITVIPFGSSATELDKIIASGNFPDIYMNMKIPPSTQIIYGKSGIFLELNDNIKLYGENIKNVFDKTPYLEELITLPNNKIYALPSVNECYHCSLSQKAWINKRWLDELGLEMPETTEEFVTVLSEFKNSDPNRNGLKDEVPIVSSTTRWNTNLDGFLMNPFVYSEQFNNNRYLLLDSGKITSAVVTDGWRQALTYLNRLNRLGLLEESSFTNVNEYMNSLTEDGEYNRLGVAIAGGFNSFSTISSGSGRWLDYVVLPPLLGPSGQRVTPRNIPMNFEHGQFIISGYSKEPELAFRWADELYNLETTLRSTIGPEGIAWDWAESDVLGINGKPAIWRHLLTFGEVTKLHWGQAAINYRSSELRLGQAVEGTEPNMEAIIYKETVEKMEPYSQSIDKIIPLINFNSDVADEVSHLQNILTTYVKEMETSFILGLADITSDVEWNKYLSRLKSLGIDRYISLYQSAYDSQWVDNK
ncbi:MAG: extracellular solute-binding protein [Spirochaetaceae bacterium]